MAISFKTDQNYGYSLLNLFGVNADLLHSAKKHGISIQQSAAGKFTVGIGEHNTMVSTVAVSGSAISLAKSGTLGPASKKALAAQFESAITKAIAMSPKAESKPAWESFPGSEEDKPESMLKPAVKAGPKPANNVVKLAEAFKLLQPVAGTSPNSVYTVVLRLKGANVAARIKGNNLSLRAEGNNMTPYFPAFQAMKMKGSDSHWSGHYDITQKDLFVKTLGALQALCGDGILEATDMKSFVGL